jgi:hypothetical protein
VRGTRIENGQGEAPEVLNEVQGMFYTRYSVIKYVKPYPGSSEKKMAIRSSSQGQSFWTHPNPLKMKSFTSVPST